MDLRQFIKPTIFKIFVFLFIVVIFLYLAKEDVCAVSLFFAFCYKAYGFPFAYLVAGSVDSASGHIRTLPLGEFFSKLGNSLLNPAALFLDLCLIYLLSCFLSMLLTRTKIKN